MSGMLESGGDIPRVELLLIRNVDVRTVRKEQKHPIKSHRKVRNTTIIR